MKFNEITRSFALKRIFEMDKGDNGLVYINATLKIISIFV